MGPEAWLTLAVLGAVVLSLARELASPAATILGGVFALLILGVLEPEQAFQGFSNPATITIAALYVVSRAVRASGGLGQLLSRALGDGPGTRRTLARLMVPSAVFSGFLNNTPLVATLAPMVREWATARGRSPSRFLMPLSFAAILGGLTTTIGTSTTLVVSGVLAQEGLGAFSLFEVTRVGLPLAVAGLATAILTTPKLLPERASSTTEIRAKGRDYTFRMRVEPDGPLVGHTIAGAGLRNLAGVYLARVDRGDRQIAPVSPDEELYGGDLLTFVGEVDHVADLRTMTGLESTEDVHVDLLEGRGHRFYEVVLGANSALVGETLKSIGFRERYDAAVMAIHRAGARVHEKLGEATLHVGDVLLVLGDPGFEQRWVDQRDFLLVTTLGEAPHNDPRLTRLSIGTLLGIIVLAGLGVLPILHASLLGVLVLVVGRVLTVSQARDAVDLDVILIVAGSFGLGAAVEASGLAMQAANLAEGIASSGGVVAALAVVMLATLVLTELISNTAAAALMVPIALDVAEVAGAEPRGFAVAVAMMASASFLTPIGYQTNTIVYGLGGYRYSDYWRLGLPLTIVVFAITLTLAPVLY